MPHADFVHLRVHSSYSLAEGALRIKELVGLCRRHRMPAVAVTDTNNLFGAMEFSLAAAAGGVQPILGCTLGLAREGDERSLGRRSPPDPIVLLVQSEAGYRNLLGLMSRAYLEGEPGEPPQVTVQDLACRSEGLIALTGGAGGPVGRLLAEGRPGVAEALLLRLAAAFPGRLYVELMRHGLAVEDRTEPGLVDLAYRHDLPLVATNDAYFADADMYEAHDVLLCVSEGAHQDDEHRRRVTPEHRFKSAEEMRELFADLPEAVDNTLTIARRCAFRLAATKPMLPPFPTESGRSEAEELEAVAAAGLEKRLRKHVFPAGADEDERRRLARPYRERLAYELGVIHRMGFDGYFLIVSDFIRWAKGQDIPVGPGRGSGAGSVVAWALEITELDPLRFGLLFERFLNPERVSMPDFDIDFCQWRRDEVIEYVRERYGREKVAQIITFGRLQARAALRDVGRVLGLSFGQVDRICKMVPFNPANPPTLAQALEAEPRLQQARQEDETVGRMIDIALRLEGLNKHASSHAAGVVIGDRPLSELVPLYRDPRSDMPVTQFSMKYVEQAGLVKFDFLGLTTLTILELARGLLAKSGLELDLNALPLDDQKTYEMLGRAETTGVFQLEGSGMREALKRLKPDCFEDIIAMVALYRPGPMNNIPRYIACKHGEEQPDYLHPTLKGVLEETFGVIIYQEQVMQIAQDVAGYTLGGADLLRRAMGKKIQAEMEAQRATFVEGAVGRGYRKDVAANLFDQVARFASYGFNKSHAAAYALVAYQTAYLKANHPVEFLAASMILEQGNADKLATLRQELDRLGIPLLPPDINRSGADFTVEEAAEEGERAIRYALAAIKNVGREAMRAVVAEREAKGPFRDVFDLCERVPAGTLNKRLLEGLVKAGALDSLERNRARLIAALDRLIQHGQSRAAEQGSDQVSLFHGLVEVASPRPALPEEPDWPMLERLRYEFEALGFYLSAHPLDGYRRSFASLGVSCVAETMERLRQHGAQRLRLAGTVLGKQERNSARGRFAFVQMSDPTGVFEVTVFAELLAQSRELLEAGAPLLVTADARLDDDTLRITATAIEPLDRISARAVTDVRLRVERPDALAKLGPLLRADGGPATRVTLVVRADGDDVLIALPEGCGLPPGRRIDVEAIPGVSMDMGAAPPHMLAGGGRPLAKARLAE